MTYSNKILILLIVSLMIFFITNLSCKKEISCEGCRDGNKPPIPIAGPDQSITLPTDSIALDGSASNDPDGTISEWRWTKISGPSSFNIANANAVQTHVSNLVAGIYHFELKVTDDKGLSAKDTVQVNVSSGNQPPIADAGADTTITLPANTINLDGSRSTDPDNDITDYTWTKISGPSSSRIANASAVKTQVTDITVGTYQFELKVTDAGALFSKDTVVIFLNTITEPQSGIWEVIITLPIDSVFIDDYYRDTEGTRVAKISGPDSGIVEGAWVKNLVTGEYLFGRYWNNDANTLSEIIKVTVLDDPNERNTITYKNLLWEYNYAWNFDGWFAHLFLSRPAWPGSINHPMEVSLQMDFFNNGEWFTVPSNIAGYDFWTDCRGFNNLCMTFFVVRVHPENSSWDGKTSNLKIKVL